MVSKIALRTVLALGLVGLAGCTVSSTINANGGVDPAKSNAASTIPDPTQLALSVSLNQGGRSTAALLADVASVSVTVTQGANSQTKSISTSGAKQPYAFNFVDFAPGLVTIEASALKSDGTVIASGSVNSTIIAGVVNHPALTLVIDNLLGSASPTVTLSQTTTLSRSVMANYTLDGGSAGWQSINYLIPEGKTVTLTATGSIVGQPGDPPVTPVGSSSFVAGAGWPLPGGYGAALAYKVGPSGTPLAVGLSTSFTMQSTASLYFAINDCCVADNTGFFDVTIRIQ